MAEVSRFERTIDVRAPWPMLVCVVLCLAACGSGAADDSAGDALYEVTRSTVSHETTQDILVFAPDGDGPWPVVWAMHGIEGSGEDVAETATQLAQKGFVVFAPTFSTDLSTDRGALEAVRDAECGYRFARAIAGDHGGDLDQPVTFLGWSLGASFVLQGGLTEEIDPTGEFLTCFGEVPRADVIVAVSGCYYEFEGMEFDFDSSAWSRKDATIVLAAGEDDAICAPWQSEAASHDLRSDGYEVDLVLLEGANHFSPIFHDLVDDELVLDVGHPAGDRIVDIVVTAVAAVGAAS